MTTKFNEFMKEIEAETLAEGPETEASLESFRQFYKMLREDIKATLHSLLVYNEVPENVSFYVIPNSVITERQRHWLHQAHNKLVNNDEMNDGMEFLCAALQENESYVAEGWKEFAGIYHQYKLANECPFKLPINRVYYSGFVM